MKLAAISCRIGTLISATRMSSPLAEGHGDSPIWPTSTPSSVSAHPSSLKKEGEYSALAKSMAQLKLMASERRVSVRGLYAYWDVTRELTGTTESSKQAWLIGFGSRPRPWTSMT